MGQRQGLAVAVACPPGLGHRFGEEGLALLVAALVHPLRPEGMQHTADLRRRAQPAGQREPLPQRCLGPGDVALVAGVLAQVLQRLQARGRGPRIGGQGALQPGVALGQ